MGGSREKTYTDLQVQPLMDHPEKWYKASMREAYKNIPAGMRSVMNSYVNNMIEARSIFNDGFLNALGYNPRENIKYRVVDPDLVLAWVRGTVSSNVSSVSDCKFANPTMEELALEYLQDTYSGMVLSEKSFLISGVRWYVSGVTVVSSIGTNATCYKDKNVTVNAYAVLHNATVISIADSMVSVNGVNYWSALLSIGMVNIPVEYITIACPGINTEINTSIINMYDGKVYSVNRVFNEEDTYSSDVIISVKLDVSGELVVSGVAKNVNYNSWSSYAYTMVTKNAIDDIVGQVKSEIAITIGNLSERLVFNYVLNGVTKLMIAEVSEDIVSGVANAKAYPIIPLRENYAFVSETNSMKAVLNKLGMAKDDFEKSLDDSRIKNAAVLFVVDLDDDSEAGTKYIFETLVNMVTTTTAGPKNTTETSYHLDYGFSDIDMKTKVLFNIRFVNGNIADVGKYVRSSVSETVQVRNEETNATENVVNTYKVIQKQVNEIYYQEIKITGSSTRWEVGGYRLEGITYIPVVDIGLDKLSYEELCYILASSVSLMTTAITVVKTKWYQSGFFKFAMIIAIVVAASFTGGAALTAAWATGNAMYVVAAMVIYAGAAVSVLGVMGVNTGIAGQVLGVAAILAGGYVAIANATTAGGQTLATASTLTQLAKVASDFNLQGTLESIEKQRVAKQAELEASGEKVQEMYDSMQGGLWMGVADRSPDMLYAMSSTQMMCNYDLLYDYDGLIDGQIKSVGI